MVVEATKTEREMKLEADLKERETQINLLEDENHRLKTPPPSPNPPPAHHKKQWFEGLTLLDS